MSAGLLTFLGIVVVAGSGLAGTLGASWISKRSSERAQENESRKIGRDEFDSFTRELRLSISDLKTELAAEKTARGAAEKRAERAEERVDRIAMTLAAHGQWDLLVLAEVRRSNEDFPDPPPLTDVTDMPRRDR